MYLILALYRTEALVGPRTTLCDEVMLSTHFILVLTLSGNLIDVPLYVIYAYPRLPTSQ